MKSNFAPMLAPNDDPLKRPTFFEELQLPLLCSPKLDGIRCLVKDDPYSEFSSLDDVPVSRSRYVCKSRKFIDLPSAQVQEFFSSYRELDGELIVGEETDFDVYNRTQSYVMSADKFNEGLRFRVFDCAAESMKDVPFWSRLAHAEKLLKEYNDTFGVTAESHASIVKHIWIDTLDELLAYESGQLSLGYEGIMMRDPVGRYKHGRGTFNEGLIYKLKRFEDFEAVVVGFKERQHNTNEDVRDALGNAKRSQAKAGLIGAGIVGKIIVDYKGELLDVACGVMKHDECKALWEDGSKRIGSFAKIRSFGHGAKDKPRFMRFVGWRDKIDM
jgi:DNA ligase-1